MLIIHVAIGWSLPPRKISKNIHNVCHLSLQASPLFVLRFCCQAQVQWMSGLTRCGHSVDSLLTCWHCADCTGSKMSPPCHYHKMSSLLSTHMHFVGRLQGSFVKSRIFFFHIKMLSWVSHSICVGVSCCWLWTNDTALQKPWELPSNTDGRPDTTAQNPNCLIWWTMNPGPGMPWA